MHRRTEKLNTYWNQVRHETGRQIDTFKKSFKYPTVFKSYTKK